MKPEIIILAAGTSARMRGTDKLLEHINGEPLLARLTKTALATGCTVNVALPHSNPARAAALHGLTARLIAVPDEETGLATSLKTALALLPADAPVILLLADMPDLTTQDLQMVLTAWHDTPDLILRGSAQDGTAGHPVCFPPWVRPDLQKICGDEGARSVLLRHKAKVRLIALPDHHATTDLDTPEDWALWRANRNS